MNKQYRSKEIEPTKVTTGPLAGSQKVYSAPEGHDDVHVPFREISLNGGEPPFRRLPLLPLVSLPIVRSRAHGFLRCLADAIDDRRLTSVYLSCAGHNKSAQER